MKKLVLLSTSIFFLLTVQKLQATNPISIEAYQVQEVSVKSQCKLGPRVISVVSPFINTIQIQNFNVIKEGRNLKKGLLKSKLLFFKNINKMATTAALFSASALLLVLFFYLGFYTSVILSFALALIGIFYGMYVMVKILKSDSLTKRQRRWASFNAWFAILAPLVYTILSIALSRPEM